MVRVPIAQTLKSGLQPRTAPVRKFGAAPANLRRADFSHALLDKASFSNVDLTGATFNPKVNLGTGTAFAYVSFGTGVICPDGSPPVAGKLGFDACRIP